VVDSGVIFLPQQSSFLAVTVILRSFVNRMFGDMSST